MHIFASKHQIMNKTIFISIIGMLALLVFQGYWLSNMYLEYKIKNTNRIEELLSLSIDDETASRAIRKPEDPNNPKLIIRKASDMTPEERQKLKGDTIYLKKAEKAGIGNSISEVFAQRMQDHLLTKRPLDIEAIDSIFGSNLKKEGIDAKFQITFFDKEHKVINSTKDSIPLGSNCIVTQSKPIGTLGLLSVQAKVKLAPYHVFQNMLTALVVSCLIISIIFGCLYYQLVVIRRMRRQLEAREAAVHSAVHDLKSPLNTVFTILDSIEQKETNTTMLQFLQDSKTKVLRLCETIESMLSMLKRTTVDKPSSEIDLPKMIEQIHSGLALLYKDKKHTYKLDYPLPSPAIHIGIDSVDLERCLRNLMENALKYSDDGVAITVSVSQNKEQIQVAVKDTGWGIPLKEQKKIGTQFYRVKQAHKPAQLGYGIGLSSVKHLVEKQGGKFTFLSIEGVGSEFFINLPL